jgi:transcriptional regulator with XRE-family HTH domain
MTTPTAGRSGEHETLSQAVARRLRGRMGELKLKGTEVAAALGMTQGSFSRRYTGTAAWELDELERLESATGIRITYLLGLEDAAGETTVTGVISRIEPAQQQQQPQQQYLDPAPIRYDHGLWPGSPAVRQAIA